jgi:hypothetical protein
MHVHNEPVPVEEVRSGAGAPRVRGPPPLNTLPTMRAGAPLVAPHIPWSRLCSLCTPCGRFRVVQTSTARTTPSTAVHRPISLTERSGKKNEIFVDILERLTVLFNSNVGRALWGWGRAGVLPCLVVWGPTIPSGCLYSALPMLSPPPLSLSRPP